MKYQTSYTMEKLKLQLSFLEGVKIIKVFIKIA